MCPWPSFWTSKTTKVVPDIVNSSPSTGSTEKSEALTPKLGALL